VTRDEKSWSEQYSRIGTLQEVIVSENRKIKRLQQQQADDIGNADKVSRVLQVAQQAVENAIDGIQQLDCLHTRVTKFMVNPKTRCIGQVLHADPIGVSSNEPDGFTIDWAVIRLNKDAFNWADFKGNKVYIGKYSISLINAMLHTYTFIAQGGRSTSKPTASSCIPILLTVLAMSTQRTACSRSPVQDPRTKSVTPYSATPTVTPRWL